MRRSPSLFDAHPSSVAPPVMCRVGPRFVVPLLIAAVFGVAPGLAGATTILAEDFNRANGTNMNGTTPDVANLPGGQFTTEVPYWTALAEGNELQIGADISLNAYLGAYDSGELSVSADVSTGNTSGPDSQMNRGVGLGFNSLATGAWNNFTGLRLTPNGDLLFQSNGTILATVSVGVFNGTPDPLSYDVDLTTGVLSNIVLQGVSADFSSIVTASESQNYFLADDYVSVFGGGSAGGQFAYVDNLSVSNSESSMPEPMSGALLGISVVGLGLVRRRRAFA